MSWIPFSLRVVRKVSKIQFCMIKKKINCVYLFSLVCFCLAKLSPVSLKNLTFYFYIHKYSLSAVLRLAIWLDTTTCNYCWNGTSLIFFFLLLKISVVIATLQFSSAKPRHWHSSPSAGLPPSGSVAKQTWTAKKIPVSQVYRKHCGKPSCPPELRI